MGKVNGVSIAPSRSWPANHYKLKTTENDPGPFRFNRAIAKLASEPPQSPRVRRTNRWFQSRHREAGQRTKMTADASPLPQGGHVSIAPSRSWPANLIPVRCSCGRDFLFQSRHREAGQRTFGIRKTEQSEFRQFRVSIAPSRSWPANQMINQFNKGSEHNSFQSRHREAGQRTRMAQCE